MHSGDHSILAKRSVISLGAVVLLANAALAIPQAQPRRIEITASRFSYSPNEITIKKDESVVLVFHTTDVTHGFTLPEMHVKSDIKKGQDAEVEFTPTEVGQFMGKCAHFCGKGHGQMTLKINVVE